MSDTDNRLRDSARALVSAAERTLGEHPPAEVLEAYHRGELPDAREEAVKSHVGSCRQCSKYVLDFARFPSVRPLPGTPDPADYLPSVEEMEQACEERERATSLPAAAAAATGRVGETGRWVGALAAGLAVGVVALGIWTVRLHDRVERGTDPRVNVPLFSLEPDESLRHRRAPSEVRLTVPGGADLFVLVLNLADAGDYAEHRVEARSAAEGADGPVVWSEGGLRPESLGTFHLVLHRKTLPAGAYRLALAGVDGERATPVAEYSFTIEYR